MFLVQVVVKLRALNIWKILNYNQNRLSQWNISNNVNLTGLPTRYAARYTTEVDGY